MLELKQRRDQLATRLTGAHPDVQALDAQIGTLSAQQRAFDQQIRRNLLRSVAAASPRCLDAVSWHAYGKSAREIRAVSNYVRARYGVPTVITEWGASSGTPGGESGQVAAFHSFLANLDAFNTPLVSIYEWQDTANAQNARERHFGLVDAAGKQKAALDAVRPVLDVP